MEKYTIGIDYGTLSARAILVSLDNGKEVATSEFIYPHAILTEKEINGGESQSETALQHPSDYILALKNTVKEVLGQSGVDKDSVVGIGIDFTSCTVLPIKKDFTPLCFLDEFKNDPHAYVKLWKHHGANKQADIMTDLAYKTNQTWIEDYGKKVSSEWCLPKVMETFNCSKKVYDAADYFVEAGDFLTWILTGKVVRSSCMAGFKSLWNKKNGYPSKDYLRALDSGLENIFEDKLSGEVRSIGKPVGTLNQYGMELLGLNKDTVVAVAVIDAHSALPSSDVTKEGELLMILGTSACHILLSKLDKNVPGICGKVLDGVVPDYYAYEAGQACFGDTFEWFINNLVPQEYFDKAGQNGQNIFDYLNDLIRDREVGESGLIVLDWFNGNRSPYADYNLSGVIVGLSQKTKAEDFYEALVCALAYGTKRIVDNYEANGIKLNKITATGGIANKNTYLMQVFADVLGRNILVAKSKQAGAKGSAIYAAVACGAFSDLTSAALVMGDKEFSEYIPDTTKNKKHEQIYAQYVKMSEYFAKQSSVMKKLKAIKD